MGYRNVLENFNTTKYLNKVDYLNTGKLFKENIFTREENLLITKAVCLKKNITILVLYINNEKPFVWYLRQLKGQKHLIVGNHDTKLLKDSEAMSYFVSVDYYREITDNQKHIVLSHYPIAEWAGFHRDVIQIFGHIHNRTEGAFQYMKQFDNALNAAACINNYTPSSLNELLRNNQIFKEANI